MKIESCSYLIDGAAPAGVAWFKSRIVLAAGDMRPSVVVEVAIDISNNPDLAKMQESGRQGAIEALEVAIASLQSSPISALCSE